MYFKEFSMHCVSSLLLRVVNSILSAFVWNVPGEDEVESAEDNPMMALFTEIYNFVDATGRAIAEPFLRLPSRR